MNKLFTLLNMLLQTCIECVILIVTDLKGDYMDFEYQASVIVPVYNVEQYLRICLDSLVNQTMDKSKMEVLVINDGSLTTAGISALSTARNMTLLKSFQKRTRDFPQREISE